MSSVPSDQSTDEGLRRPSYQAPAPSQSSSVMADKDTNKTDQHEPLLDDPQAREPPVTSTSSQTNSAAQPPHREGKKCWICQMEDTEDTSEDVVWRSPCPCSLVAHDECLLEWVADGEAPKNGGITRKFFCPVCKFEIQIQRPRSPILERFNQVQSSARSLVYPITTIALLGCGYAGLFAYGVNTLYLVFGNDEAVKILVAMRGTASLATGGGPLSRGALGTIRDLVTGADPFWPSVNVIGWKQWVGLPLIAPLLGLSRSTLGNYVFPFVVCGYFTNSTLNRDIYHWPPSPGLAFAVLPYFRAVYNSLYRITFADLEKGWDLAVQRKPRESETTEQNAQAAIGGGDNLFGILIEDDEFDARGNRIRRGDIDFDAPIENPHADDVGRVQVRRRGQDIFFPRNWTARDFFTSGTGALLFPLISSTMGTILEVLLPAKWVGHAPYKGRITGHSILQEKWGRTIVGGCLFVVLKDVLTLYCKWRKAQDFGKINIMDFKRPSGRV